MSEAIAVRDLTKFYGRLAALQSVTLTVARGEMLAVLGPSGCGKSTLLKVLAGLTAASAGEVYLGGRRVDTVPPQERQIGVVFQNYALFERMTVEENILFGLRIRNAGRELMKSRLEELLRVTGLLGQEKKYPCQLSGGQQQRVALARALAPKPGVILLDEPLSALDIQVRRSLRGELKDIQQKLGVTTIIVTHDQEEAFELGDRVAVMNAGRVEQVGTPRDVYQLPQSEFIAGFVGENNILPGEAVSAQIFVAGSFFAPAPRAYQGAVKIYVRPEDVNLARSGRKEESGLFGTITRVRFSGASYCYTVALRDGQEISALLARPQAALLNLIPGDAVRVTGKPNLIVPLPAAMSNTR